MPSCTNLLADHNAAGIRQSSEEGINKALQNTERCHCGDRTLRLSSDHDIDQHLTDAVKQLIAQNRKTFGQIGSGKSFSPVEHFLYMQGNRLFIFQQKHCQDDQIDNAGNQRAYRRACRSHLRHAEPSVDQNPVQDKIDYQRNCGRNEGNLDALRRPHQKADDHRQYLQRISKANDPDIGNRHLYNIFLICINPKQKFRLCHRYCSEQKTDKQHKAHGKPKGFVDTLFTFGTPILGKEQKRASCKSEIAGEKQRRNLRADADRRDR